MYSFQIKYGPKRVVISQKMIWKDIMQTCITKHDLKLINTQYVDLDLNLKLFKKISQGQHCQKFGSLYEKVLNEI